MIIFGTRTCQSIKQASQFHCPHCSVQRVGHVKRADRYFTLYFIPLIPLGSVGEFVECTSCGGTFGIEILSYNPQVERAQSFIDIRRMLVLAMVASRRTEPQHIDALVELFGTLSGSYISADEIRQEILLAQQAGAPLAQFVGKKVASLNDQGRKLVLDSAAQIMSHGSALTESDKHVLRELGQSLGLSQQQIEPVAGRDPRRLT